MVIMKITQYTKVLQRGRAVEQVDRKIADEKRNKKGGREGEIGR